MVREMELKDIILETINDIESLPEGEEEASIRVLQKQDITFETLHSAKNTQSAQSTHTFLGDKDATDKELKNFANQNFNLSERALKNLNTMSLTNYKPSVFAAISEASKGDRLSNEKAFLQLLEERLLVLFEGLNTDKQSDKYEMVLNFLRYELSVIQKRLDILQNP